tara:strand:+ start:200 stop:343 length:144 start_codon:yes stop_codon:yes gene_type:complete
MFAGDVIGEGELAMYLNNGVFPDFILNPLLFIAGLVFFLNVGILFIF